MRSNAHSPTGVWTVKGEGAGEKVQRKQMGWKLISKLRVSCKHSHVSDDTDGNRIVTFPTTLT